MDIWIVIEDDLVLGAVSSKEELSRFNINPEEFVYFSEGATLMRNNDGGPVTIQHCFLGKPIYQD